METVMERPNNCKLNKTIPKVVVQGRTMHAFNKVIQFREAYRSLNKR